MLDHLNIQDIIDKIQSETADQAEEQEILHAVITGKRERNAGPG